MTFEDGLAAVESLALTPRQARFIATVALRYPLGSARAALAMSSFPPPAWSGVTSSHIQRNVRYLLRYCVRYQIPQIEEVVAPSVPHTSSSETSRYARSRLLLVVEEGRHVPPAGVKSGVAEAGGATPWYWGRSPRKNEVRTKRDSVCVRGPSRDAAVLCARFVGDIANDMLDHMINTTTVNDREFIAWRSLSSLQLGREV